MPSLQGAVWFLNTQRLCFCDGTWPGRSKNWYLDVSNRDTSQQRCRYGRGCKWARSDPNAEFHLHSPPMATDSKPHSDQGISIPMQKLSFSSTAF